ncbi:hypothetical protein PMIN03_005776 [Paraphaeosphaeria minitans]
MRLGELLHAGACSTSRGCELAAIHGACRSLDNTFIEHPADRLSSAADETTACVTTTIFTTTTVTVTKPQVSSLPSPSPFTSTPRKKHPLTHPQHPSNIIVVSSTPSESPALSSSAEPVLPTPAPVNPNVTASEPSVVITSTSLSYVASFPKTAQKAPC